MDCEIRDMELSSLPEYAELFKSVFNADPWNDAWTTDTAALRIENMMRTNTFAGLALYSGGELKGIIFGQKEQYFNGIHFQIQEFCVRTSEQGRGYGKALLDGLKKRLSDMGAVNIFLITARGERTEGYYQRQGFVTSDYMILMTNNSFQSDGSDN
ncbi:MAG: GNAT family N-acetyltransferase [Ruminococcus sp.]|nr:GNAT family N-acetyltransferase [Ruminococcus sp.]